MPNLAETPRAARIRIWLETILYLFLLCFIIPIRIDHDKEQFEIYLRTFNKSYENDTIYKNRLEAFKASLRTIDLMNTNRTNHSARYGLTKYSDMLPEEFRITELLPNINLRYSPKSIATNHIIKRAVTSRFDLPKKVDWRQRNAVNDIQSQGHCGACWAFSVIGVIESMMALKTGILKKLSVQQMIDCSRYNDGCNGGDICSLLRWIKTESVPIALEKEYPLSLTRQACKNVSGIGGIIVNDFECNSFVDDEDVILALLAKLGPVAVAINAQTWQHYVGGIIQFHCESNPSQLNHAVQIVGYDLTADIPHYIVRNSWGEDFGEEGYLYIAIGDNLCGLAHEVSAVRVL